MKRPPAAPRHPCPGCGQALRRARRTAEDRQQHGGRGLYRFRCPALDCGWAGLLPPRPAGVPSPLWATARRAGLALLGGSLLVAAAATAWQALRPAAAPKPWRVGPHLVLPGTHLEGDHLPKAHPLTAALGHAAQDDEPAAYSQEAQSQLRARRHCAWGLPGRNPYRGSVEQALQTAQLSPAVVQKIAADVRAGRKVDRLVIDNRGIRARDSGRRFDGRRVAMTYGMTLCVDTRVNFQPGHREGADLYEAMDEDGRVYAVMVPEVCGNVSVLGQRGEIDIEPGAGPSTRGQTPLPKVLALPPELRPRELPVALLYNPPGTTYDDGDEGGDPGGQLPLPDTLSLAALALGAVALLRRRRKTS